MLETKDLVKIYRPKKGVPVVALNKVSLTFADKGMVFLLGKSGSGKSTLLNVLGGLDKYDDGEIIIKGISTKSFNQQHFDSYRNTYVGFIFQEYNILDEFSVGANIALAIELQGKKATDEIINDILKQVDLEGYGNRKPNELSGGQKQRVAIARALVKNPQIIMADEPTGALDSNTGKQVFDTLKELSKTKLVIVVSHDRDFAETYADRIIELADGVVISDVQVFGNADASPIENTLEFYENSVSIPEGYHLTEEDRLAINDYIDKLASGSVDLNISKKKNSSKKFLPTDTSNIIREDGSTFKLIKSKLPLKNAFKIGSGGLKYKKIRLTITIILSCIAFTLFGLADTFSSYDLVKACTSSLIDSDMKYISVAKAQCYDDYWVSGPTYLISENGLEEIEEETGVKMHGVYRALGSNMDFSGNINDSISLTETYFDVYLTSFVGGYAEIDNNLLEEMDFTILAGTLPDGKKNEIAVSEYIYEVFHKAQYRTNADSTEFIDIDDYDDLVGKTILLDNSEYTITAIIDTNFDLERYNILTESDEDPEGEDLSAVVDYALYSELASSIEYNFATIAMVGEGKIDTLIAESSKMIQMNYSQISFYNDDGDGLYPTYTAPFSSISNEKIIWIDGERSTLGEKEILVTSDLFYSYDYVAFDTVDYVKTVRDLGEIYATEFVGDDYEEVSGYKIVGVIDNTDFTSNSKLNSAVIGNDKFFSKFAPEAYEGPYAFAIGVMPESKSDIKNFVEYSYREDADYRYEIQSFVTFELNALNEVFEVISDVFISIGIAFAVFASIMLANFIGTSISYKKQEIGILRAIGSRSNDVFRIFFAESFIIAMINYVLSIIGVATITALINNAIHSEVGLLITIISFGFRQIVLLFAVSVLVAFAASFIPVMKIASKRPIDAIRNR